MIGDITGVENIYMVCGYTDMRKSIDGLCAVVGRCDRIKALLWEGLSAHFCYPHLFLQSTSLQ